MVLRDYQLTDLTHHRFMIIDQTFNLTAYNSHEQDA